MTETVRIAGFSVAIDLGETAWAADLDRLYAPWLTSEPPAFRLTATLDDAVAPVTVPSASWDGRALVLRDGRYEAAFDRDEKTGVIRTALALEDAEWDTILRNLAYLLVLSDGGLAFHAAAVDTPPGAALLVGPSGIGKTTAARRFGRGTVYSDEHALLAPRGDRFFLLPTPAWGHFQAHVDTGAPRPVAALYLIRKTPRLSTVPLSRAEAAARLVQVPAFECTGLPFEDSILEALDRLLATVPCWDLGLPLRGEILLPHLREGQR